MLCAVQRYGRPVGSRFSGSGEESCVGSGYFYSIERRCFGAPLREVCAGVQGTIRIEPYLEQRLTCTESFRSTGLLNVRKMKKCSVKVVVD